MQVIEAVPGCTWGGKIPRYTLIILSRRISGDFCTPRVYRARESFGTAYI